MNRRRFMKYAGAAAATVGASAAAYYLYNTGLRRNVEVTIPSATKTESTASTRVNHPPVANLKYKPSYLNPTDQQAIQFTNYSTDPDDDPLTYKWLVDNQPVSNEKDYSTKLPVGQHLVELEASDPFSKNTTTQTVTVEPDQIYPTKQLHIEYKGITYFAGNLTPGWPLTNPLSKEKMDEQLDTICNDLGCNAIIISAGPDYEDYLIQCAQLAINKEFDRIYLQPQYENATVDETVRYIEEFAKKARVLRGISDKIVLNVGHEFAIETAIVEGEDWWGRVETLLVNGKGWDKVNAALPRMFDDIINVCNENYGSKITYSSMMEEEQRGLIPWDNPIFESVGTDAYIQDKIGIDWSWIYNFLSKMKKHRKPVYSTEAGSMTFKGADQLGSDLYQVNGKYVWDLEPYDEDAQANYINKYCQMLNSTRIDGFFYTQYNMDAFEKGYGLCNDMKRKKGFYMYKSYQRTS